MRLERIENSFNVQAYNDRSDFVVFVVFVVVVCLAFMCFSRAQPTFFLVTLAFALRWVDSLWSFLSAMHATVKMNNNKRNIIYFVHPSGH